MTVRSALIRALATFIIGASASPGVSAIFEDVATLQAVAIAGLIAVWNLIVRAAQAWLDAHPETFGRLGQLGTDRGAVDPGSCALGVVLGVVLMLLLWVLTGDGRTP